MSVQLVDASDGEVVHSVAGDDSVAGHALSEIYIRRDQRHYTSVICLADAASSEQNRGQTRWEGQYIIGSSRQRGAA